MCYKVICPSTICPCNEKWSIVKNNAILFDKHIIDIDSLENLQKKYKIDEIIKTDNILMPSFSNPHIHLEFLNNKNTLKYGSFTNWLYSVIANRDNLIKNLNNDILQKSINNLISYGTTSIGAISSLGLEAKMLSESKMNVVLFNEVLGVVAEKVDENFDIFKKKFSSNSKYSSDKFNNQIAIHSPYSVHPKLIEKSLRLCSASAPISLHFMESLDERLWIDSNDGELKKFFKDFFNINKNILSSENFMDFFKDRHSIFVHGNYMNKNEKDKFNNIANSFIINCPKSNRLLGSKKLNLKNFKENKIGIGTDGLSSNNSTHIIDELKYSLFMNEDENIQLLAEKLLISATNTNAKALNINAGSIEIGKKADFILLENINSDNEYLAMDIILHTDKPNKVYIDGKLF